MISGPEFLFLSTTISLGVLTVALLLTIFRIVVGPTMPDRILALDMLVAVVIGYIVVIAIRTGFVLYLDIAIALGLVGFLSTVAFSRFVLQRWQFNQSLSEKNFEETRE
jgi:multicomponent Na+:H+ antiporter subunit F